MHADPLRLAQAHVMSSSSDLPLVRRQVWRKKFRGQNEIHVAYLAKCFPKR